MPPKGTKRDHYLRLTCPTCGELFLRSPGYIGKGQNKWCSNKCRHATLPQDRFWPRIDRRGADECWEWQGTGVRRDGYGYFFVMDGPKGRRQIGAHRFSWQLHFGPIPNALCVLHKCDNRLCVNPSHLFLGTKKDNNRDMANKGRCVPALKYRVLTDDQALEIIRRSKAGESYAETGGSYGVSGDYVGMIARGEAYRRLHDAA